MTSVTKFVTFLPGNHGETKWCHSFRTPKIFKFSFFFAKPVLIPFAWSNLCALK